MVNLTKNEKRFLTDYLENNGCGALTPQELLEDNFSCFSIQAAEEELTNYTPNQIRGFLSSLIEKDVLWFEERDAYRVLDNDGLQPSLYWVSDEFLKDLQPNLTFKDNLCN